jgi:hypothetical protein
MNSKEIKMYHQDTVFDNATYIMTVWANVMMVGLVFLAIVKMASVIVLAAG